MPVIVVDTGVLSGMADTDINHVFIQTELEH